jgi:ribonuclease HII
MRPRFPHYDLGQGAPWPVCGVDEAGRGPWAGPVCAAAVILNPDDAIEGLNDSKALSAEARDALALAIRARALAFGVGFASVAEIDRLNILQATGLAMRRAVATLSLLPALALVDGSYCFRLSCEVRPLIKGDSLCASIAAASILAKTARDRRMEQLDRRHPGYGFARHKGYGVPAHAQALASLGPCAIHRRSFAPVREAYASSTALAAASRAAATAAT